MAKKKDGSWWKLGLAIGAIGGFVAWQKTQGDTAARGQFVTDGHKGTAVITGASSGIGETYARHLAKAGYNLVLVARRKEKLKRIASELSLNHGVLVEVAAADLATDEGIERIEETIGKLDDLALLINNAGFGSYGPLIDKGLFKQLDMIHLHVNATMRLTRAAVTKMLPKRQGAVINVSSIASFFHGANSANYCSTKAYVRIFSQAVYEEVKDDGLYVQALCPGYVYTEFHDSNEYDEFERSDVPSWLWASADEVVAESLNSLGSGKVVLIPGFVNQAIVGLAKVNIEMADLRKLAKVLTGKA
ncbi:MAG: SDR family oxidoreductase [Anaerolineales bacterium]|nr:SDR family oxidoreductase [Anaerolineales bacterium]